MELNIKVTEKQMSFIEATETEVLFGGAAGGGKSYGQTVDALLFALKYPRSRQLILRRTFPELEKSLRLLFISGPFTAIPILTASATYSAVLLPLPATEVRRAAKYSAG